MEDWEQHFAEKSRRRFEKEEASRRRARRATQLTLLTIGGVLAAAIVGLVAIH